jgi:hypothetical protein
VGKAHRKPAEALRRLQDAELGHEAGHAPDRPAAEGQREEVTCNSWGCGEDSKVRMDCVSPNRS